MSEFHLERSLHVRAARATVWRFFEDSQLFARWWGEGSSIEARVGAPLRIRYPNGDTASGEIRSLVPSEEIEFSFGYDQEGKPIPPGGSLVRIRLSDHEDGTLVSLRHTVADEATREMHLPGWRYQLAVFAKVACDEQHAGLGERVADWFAAWNADAEAERERLLAGCCSDDLRFADAFGNVEGRQELLQHIAQARRFMPVKLQAIGAVRQALGTAVVDWEMQGPDGKALARGSNVMRLASDGAIREVVGVPA